ncbi:MAG: hypothetical protein WC007_02905 [Pelobacteraceae bacterium]
MKKFLLLATVLVFCISGCGSSNGGGTTFYKTVNATVSVDSEKNPLFSDLAKWADINTSCNGVQVPTNTSDLVNFTITTVKSISSGTASNLMLQKATIVFTPADTLSPALPAQYATSYIDLFGLSVPADGSVAVPVEVVTHNLKSYFYPTAVCRNVPVYSYNVQVSFDAIEAGTGKSGTITAGMTVRIADFAD